MKLFSNKKKAKTVKTLFYKDCSDLFIFNFDAIATKGDLSWLVVGYDGYNKVEYDPAEANQIWNAIYKEWCELNEDTTTLMYYELLHEVGKLKIRRYVVAVLLDQIEKIPRPKKALKPFTDEMAKWGFVMDIDGEMEYQLSKMHRQLRASLNQIEMKEAELEVLSKGSEDSMSLVQQCVKLEQGLGRNDINTKKTTVLKWIALLQEMRAINEQRNKKRVA